MHTLTIKTHRKDIIYPVPHFYILNKGLNSGKPLLNPCPNCFVILCNNEDEKEQLYWLCVGLWQSKTYHPFLRGSVIPFVNLSDVNSCISQAYKEAKESFVGFQKSIKTLRSLEELERQYKQNSKLIQDAKRVVFYRYMK